MGMRWLLCSNKPQVLLPGRFVYGTANVRAGCLPQGLGGEDLQLVAKCSDFKTERECTQAAGAGAALSINSPADIRRRCRSGANRRRHINRIIAATATRTRYLPSHAPP